MNWRRRSAQPSPEAVAARAAAERAHAQAVADLEAQQMLEGEVAAVRDKLADHTEANHWVDWLLGLQADLAGHRRPA